MTQAEKILNVLQEKNGGWVSGTYFLRTLYLSQYHARIFDLQKKGYKIEASDFVDEHGFKSYRLITEPKVLQLPYIAKIEIDEYGMQQPPSTSEVITI